MEKREVKVGDWGWFWDDEPEYAMFDRVFNIYPSNKHFKYASEMSFDGFQNFSHDHPTGKFTVIENNEKIKSTDLKVKFSEAASKRSEHDRHAELKKAFEDGKKLQILSSDGWGDWEFSHCPRFGAPIEHYRIKPEPEYEPYTWEDRHEFRDLWVVDEGQNECRIVMINDVGICIEQDRSYLYDQAFDDLKKLDGTPFGKLKK